MLFLGTLRWVEYTFPFLPCFSFLLFLWLLVKPSQTTTLLSCFSFSLGWFCLLPPAQCYGPPSIALRALCLQELIPWICSLTIIAYSQGNSSKSYLADVVVFPRPEFCYEKLMIWATVSSKSCFGWLYTVSPSLATKNVINLISVLATWWCPCVKLSLVLLKKGIFYDQYIFLAKFS